MTGLLDACATCQHPRLDHRLETRYETRTELEVHRGSCSRGCGCRRFAPQQLDLPGTRGGSSRGEDPQEDPWGDDE